MTYRFVPHRNIQQPNVGDGMADLGMGELQSGSAVAPSNTPPNILKCPDFKVTPALAVQKRSYKVGKYYNSRNIKWYANNQTINDLLDMKTFVSGKASGLDNGRVAGTVFVCWYAEFRGVVA